MTHPAECRDGRKKTSNERATTAKYTLEFKREAVRQVRTGRAQSVVAKTLGVPKGSLTNWVRADAQGQLGIHPLN